MSLETLKADPYLNNSTQVKNHFKQMEKYFKGRLHPNQVILDIGGRSPSTEYLEQCFGIKIYNTKGDLDTNDIQCDINEADVVIYSHTIEHQFNPLHTLLWIKERMKKDAKLYILLPSRGKLLWASSHYHEIDHYRMQMLLERAGLKIIDYTRIKENRGFWNYFKGIRMFLRLFLEYDAHYVCILDNSEI